MIVMFDEGSLMFLNSGLNTIKKAGLLVFLLIQSMLVQAQEVSAASVTTAEVEESAVTSASEDPAARTFSFPQWPERKQISRERVPLAPPGPYMSSALSDFSFKGPTFDRDINRRPVKTDSADFSMDKFSPDTPWPSQANSPTRWRPDNGYRYVRSRARSNSNQVMPYNFPANNNYRYNTRSPVMNRSDEPGRSNPGVNGYTR